MLALALTLASLAQSPAGGGGGGVVSAAACAACLTTGGTYTDGGECLSTAQAVAGAARRCFDNGRGVTAECCASLTVPTGAPPAAPDWACDPACASCADPASWGCDGSHLGSHGGLCCIQPDNMCVPGAPPYCVTHGVDCSGCNDDAARGQGADTSAWQPVHVRVDTKDVSIANFAFSIEKNSPRHNSIPRDGSKRLRVVAAAVPARHRSWDYVRRPQLHAVPGRAGAASASPADLRGLLAGALPGQDRVGDVHGLPCRTVSE